LRQCGCGFPTLDDMCELERRAPTATGTKILLGVPGRRVGEELAVPASAAFIRLFSPTPQPRATGCH
jgi:hypothetical protein